MTFVDHVPDRLVTELVYQHLPSWHAVACYFDWRRQYAARVRDEEFAKAKDSRVGRSLARTGAVLTNEGWVIPTGPLNPRIIDQPGTTMMSPREIEEQARNDEEVRQQRADHELAVLYEDLAIFGLQWQAVMNQTQATRRQLLKARGRSEEREAYMVRWHGDHPH